MREDEHQSAPYWQQDLAIGEGRFYRDTYAIRLKLHSSEERISWTEELFPLSQAQKRDRRRRYFHGRPYILIPDYSVQVAMHPQPQPSGSIGEVVGASWEGMKHEEIGNAQAWYYPIDRTLILWECYLDDRFKQSVPKADDTLKRLWAGFEQVLLDHCAGIERIYTTWEDIYECGAWQDFVEAQSYRQAGAAAFLKEVVRR